MIRVAIVEDEQSYAIQLQQYIERYSKECGDEIQYLWFSDGDEILENYKTPFDIILLDIQMQFMDGMTTAEAIRKFDSEVIIIFITNMPQYAIRGYAVDALDYVLKPVSYFAFSQRLERAIARMQKRTHQYMTISIRGGTQKIDISTIYYVESQGHNLIFHTKNGNYTTVRTIRMAEEKLQGYGFYRCNRGYIVNLSHVNGIQEGCAIVGSDKVLISRSRKTGFLQALTNHVGEVMK